jgi:peptidoglycan hydrolase-like protein with peptidoglycan-binding domain
MKHPTLRLYDGFDHTSPELGDEVKALQTALNHEGFSLPIDGLFGRETESAVKQFQREHSLDDDGVAGPLTWAALLGTKSPDPSTVWPTTFAGDNTALLAQFTEARTKYQAFIDGAATQCGFPPCVIGGLGSRESQWGLALKPVGPAGTGDFAPRRFPARFRAGALPPDGGFGRGLLQIDYDAYDFARTGDWKDPAANIRFGCQVLAASRDFIRRKTGLEGRALLQAALAGYNAGPGNALRALRDGYDIDFFTAGRNYSKDVLNPAGFFQLRGWI